MNYLEQYEMLLEKQGMIDESWAYVTTPQVQPDNKKPFDELAGDLYTYETLYPQQMKEVSSTATVSINSAAVSINRPAINQQGPTNVSNQSNTLSNNRTTGY